MKREEFIKKCDHLRYETKWSAKPWHYWLDEMANHDAEQRAEIARLRAALKDAMNLIDVDNLTTQTVYRNCQHALKETTT